MGQFTIYRSTDSSAPVLSGTTGSLVNVLDKCLVDGYGTQVGAGWTKPYTGTNKAAFKQGSGSCGFYLRVLDDGSLTFSTTSSAKLTGYETMTDVDTGTFQFPNAVQGSTNILGGVAARKSANTTSTARPWIIAADSRTVYAFMDSGDTAGKYTGFMFGDFYSFVPNDRYRCILIGHDTEVASYSNNNESLGILNVSMAANAGEFVARGHTGFGGSVAVGKHGDYAKGGSAVLLGTVPFPNPVDGGLYLSPLWIHDPTTAPAPSIRGRMRGFWHFLHPVVSVTDGDVVSGSAAGSLTGKTFLFIKSSGTAGVYTLETSNTVDTN